MTISNHARVICFICEYILIFYETTQRFIVIRIKLAQVIDDFKFDKGRKISYSELSEKTGISRSTLNRIANVPGYITTTEVIDKLCEFFDCQPGDLMSYVPAKKSEQNS
jgi:putative transcriptional regulator